MKKLLFIFSLLLILGTITIVTFQKHAIKSQPLSETNYSSEEEQLAISTHPLQITELRKKDFLGSDIAIEQTLNPGSNYKRYIASYQSEGLKIYGLLTIPNAPKPTDGFPVIIFNHGYIPPTQYRTTEKYIAYTDAFSRNGYVLFKPDYRGHGSSEGAAAGGYGSNDYTIDVLNALSSIKKLKDPADNTRSLINSEKIGMWGHSMGGFITLRSMVVTKDIKVGVIWAGVVAPYEDLLSKWRRPNMVPGTPSTRGGSWRQMLIENYGIPEKNPEFWKSISANSYLNDISGPLQLHHGTADTSVPLEFSQILKGQMEAVEKEVELYTYQGDDHNLSGYFGTAIQRSVEFFDKYLK